MANSNQNNQGGNNKQSGSNNSNNSNASNNKQSDSGSNSKQSDNNSNRGFASMDPEQQREIAAEGGRAAHAAGTAHEFTSEEARKAGSLSHKNTGNEQSGSSGSRGGDGNSGGQRGGQGGAQGSTRGGTPEQHAEAGRQSHKNDRN